MKNIYKINYLQKVSFFSCFLILFCSLTVFSQQIKIGLKADIVDRIIKSEVQTNLESQGYNQVSEQYSPQYYNGKLIDIILCKQNVPLIDLHRTGDFCIHHIMKNGILSIILIEYSNVSTKELKSLMNRNQIQIGNYYFGTDDNENYCKIYLSGAGHAIKEYRSAIYNPLPVNIQNELIAQRQKNEVIEIFDANKADDYRGFIPQQTKIYYTAWSNGVGKNYANKNIIKKANFGIKAILAYYTGVCSAFGITENLGLGEACSTKMSNYISMFFEKNDNVLSDISQCKIQTNYLSPKSYSLDRLEFTLQDNLVTTSYAIVYYENNSSKDTIVGTDQFKINSNHTLTVLKISPKIR